jgi:hypothetical protein
MDVRSINEAARLLVLEAATLVDKIEETRRIAKVNNRAYNHAKSSAEFMCANTSTWKDPDTEKAIEAAEDRLGLMTPVLKGVITDYGVENAIKMQQVWGGHGYVRDNGMEQIVRDARIAMIYEGANGIQALDLVGRKLPKNMGRAVMRFFKDTESFLTSSYEHDINHIVQPMTQAVSELKQATEWLAANGMKNPNDAGSASYPYMKMFGLVLLGLAHIRICLATDDKARHTTATYFMENVLPEASFLLKKIRQGSQTMMALTPDEF